MSDTTKIEALTNDFKSYLHTSKELIQLQITEKIAVVTASLIQYLIIGVALLFCLLFLSVSLGLYMSHVFDSYLYGFLCVSSLYVVITVVLVLANKPLILNPVINTIILKISNSN